MFMDKTKERPTKCLQRVDEVVRATLEPLKFLAPDCLSVVGPIVFLFAVSCVLASDRHYENMPFQIF